MKNFILNKYGFVIYFFVIGCILIVLSSTNTIGDFGNYYYGSKLFYDSKFSILDYENIAHFNAQIKGYGETNFFENYTPVPPPTLLFYLPFLVFSSLKAKLAFNCISLLVFCFVLQRFLTFLNYKNGLNYFIPIIFAFTLYSNFSQGQTYLLVSAFIIESYIRFEKKNYVSAALFLSISISLKIFPVFILLFFLFKKQYKVIIYTLLFVLIIQSLTLVLVGKEIVLNYYITILPRLVNNDVIGTYHSVNQSTYTLLLRLFSFDELNNPLPILNLPFLVPVIEGIIVSFVIYFLFQLKKINNAIYFAIIGMSIFIVGRYNPTYSYLLLIPSIIIFINQLQNTNHIITILAVLFICINLPVIPFFNKIYFLKFIMLFSLIFIMFNVILPLKPLFSFKLLILICVVIIPIKYFSFSIKNINYFKLQNTQGILYNYSIKNDSITFVSTLGVNTFKEHYYLPGKKEKTDDLCIKHNQLFYKNKLICNTADNKLNPFIYSDTLAVFMSDLNQGVGFYKLRYLNLK